MLFYQNELVSLHCGHCADVIEALEPYDLLLTDPPYGQDYQSNRRKAAFAVIANDKPADMAGVLEDLGQALKKLRRGRHAYIFGRPDVSALPVCGITEIIWDKNQIGMGDLTLPWASAFEPITFCVYELSAANRKKGFGNLAARMRRGNILKVQRIQGGAVTRHPTEKPVLLLRQLIESSSVIGEMVFDPFAGVGSTLVAAYLEGRRAIGVEIEEKYCKIAKERMICLEGLAEAVGKI